MYFEWLKGEVCTGVEPHTEHSTRFRFGAASLIVESLWRIRVQGQLRRTSLDDGQQFGLPARIDVHAEALELLDGQPIVDVRLDQRCGDLTLAFDSELALEVITDSSGYEAWQLFAPGKHFVAGSGGQVHDLSAEA